MEAIFLGCMQRLRKKGLLGQEETESYQIFWQYLSQQADRAGLLQSACEENRPSFEK